MSITVRNISINNATQTSKIYKIHMDTLNRFTVHISNDLYIYSNEFATISIIYLYKTKHL